MPNHQRWMLAFLLSLTVAGMSVRPAAQSGVPKEAKGVVFYVQAGRLDKLSQSEAILKIAVGPHAQSMAFLINKTAIIDRLVVGNRVNAIYTRQDSQNILVSLQRLPDFNLGRPPVDEHLGVAEMEIPQKQSSELSEIVGTIEPGAATRTWNEATRTVAFSGQEAERGSVSGVTWLSPTAYKLLLNPQAPSGSGSEENKESRQAPADWHTLQAKFDILVDALTRVDGHMEKGSTVQVRYKDEDGQKVATLVTVTDAGPAAGAKTPASPAKSAAPPAKAVAPAPPPSN
jgi:Cu/Ag efflux protein CusF